MLLKDIDKERLETIQKAISDLKMKFPVAQIAKDLDVNEGTVSRYINGKIPMSGKFYESFMDYYNIGDIRIEAAEDDFFGTNSALFISLQAAIKVLTGEAIQSNIIRTGRPEAVVRSEIQKAMKEMYNQLLGSMRKK